MDLAVILSHASNENITVREQAEQQLRQFEAQNYPLYLQALGQELVSEERPQHHRRLAGIILKNSLDTKDETRVQRWLVQDVTIRDVIKRMALHCFASPIREVRGVAAQLTSRIALIELPKGQWPTLIQLLLANVTAAETTPLVKQASLETLGFICEDIDAAAIKEQSNLILTAVIQGMKRTGDPAQFGTRKFQDDLEAQVVLAAATALYNALEFVKENFQKENERSYIMQVVCETTQAPEIPIRCQAFQCLVKIATLHYDKLAQYMQRIFEITMRAIRTPPTSGQGEDNTALQAIEFWSTICDEEIERLEEIEEAQENGTPTEVQCHYFIKGARQFLVEALTEMLTRQDEDADEDTWNESMAAGTCLGLIANTILDDVVPLVIPFVEKNITSNDWRLREAATMAFGSILEGPKTRTLAGFIVQALPVLVKHLKDGNVHVKDTAAWTIGRICQLHSETLTPELLNGVVAALADSLKDESPRVASNACWAIHNIALSFQREEEPPHSPLSPMFQPLLKMLLMVTERPDAAESNLRTSAYESINILIQAAAKDCHGTILELLPLLLDRLQATFSIQVLSTDDKDNQTNQQALLCGSLQVITQKLESQQLKPHADRLMSLYLQVFQHQSATVQEEALMAVGALANAVEGDFEKYMLHIKEYLARGLRNWQEHSVCSVAVGTIGDICRAINEKIFPFCDEIITLLLEDLKNPNLDRTVKPPILVCFGDIALAIGGAFEKYLGIVMTVLAQASQTSVDLTNYEMVEYLNALHESIFEAYTGIIQGLRSDNKAHLFIPFAEHAVLFIEAVYRNPEKSDHVLRGAVGVLGDIAHALANVAPVKALLQREMVKQILSESKRSTTQSIRETANWAYQVISKIN